MARSIKEVHTINYYPINEGAARRAKEMNSFSDYKEGSATAEYRAMVDKRRHSRTAKIPGGPHVP